MKPEPENTPYSRTAPPQGSNPGVLFGCSAQRCSADPTHEPAIGGTRPSTSAHSGPLKEPLREPIKEPSPQSSPNGLLKVDRVWGFTIWSLVDMSGVLYLLVVFGAWAFSCLAYGVIEL